MRHQLVITAVVIAATIGSAQALERGAVIEGPARVVDGDTIDVAGFRRRCGVHHEMVGKMRSVDTGGNRQYETRTFVHPKTGQPTQMRPPPDHTYNDYKYEPPSRTFIHPKTGQPTQMRPPPDPSYNGYKIPISSASDG